MKIALQYLNKTYLFNIKSITKDEEEDKFFSNHYTYYVSSEDGKIHKSKMSENIIYYINNNIIYFITSLYKTETLKNFLEIKEDALNGVYDIKEVIKENLKTFKIDGDLSEKSFSEISGKLKVMLAEKEIEYKKKQEEKEKINKIKFDILEKIDYN